MRGEDARGGQQIAVDQVGRDLAAFDREADVARVLGERRGSDRRSDGERDRRGTRRRSDGEVREVEDT